MESPIAQSLFLVGIIINLVGYVMFLVAAKRVSMGWFIGCLFMIVWPFFCFAYFSRAWKPLAVWFAGLLVAGIGTMVGGA